MVNVQGGPLLVASRVMTPSIEVITCYKPNYPFVRPFIRVTIPFITIVGAPPCRYTNIPYSDPIGH